MPLVTLNLRYDLSYIDLINALCWQHRETEADDELPWLTVRAIREQVRDTLKYAGCEAPAYWRDDLDEFDRIESWAQECIARAWPDMVPRSTGSQPSAVDRG